MPIDGDVSRTAAVHMAVHNTAQDGCDHGHCVRVPSGVAVALHCVSTGSACGGLQCGLRCSICISCGGVGCCGMLLSIVACRGMLQPAGCRRMSRRCRGDVAGVSRDVVRCRRCVTRCRGGVARCRGMSWRCRGDVARCREVSRGVTRCHRVSLHVSLRSYHLNASTC